MKFYNTLSLALLLMLSTEALAQGISFLDNRPMEEVLSQAKKEGKMVFVDCYATWCVPCKMLSTKVFPQKEAGDFFNPRFVSLKLDMEKGEGPEMGKKWDVGAYPTLIFMNSDGEVQFQLVGARDSKHLVDTVAVLLENSKPSELAVRYKSGERSSRLVMDYIHELQGKRKMHTVEAVAVEFVNTHQQSLLNDTLAQQILGRYVQDPHNDGFLYAYSIRDQLPKTLVEQMEIKWKTFTKSYYIPASFIMKNKRMMLECLEMSKDIDRIAPGQISMAINTLEKSELSDSEKQQLEALKKHYDNKIINTQN